MSESKDMLAINLLSAQKSLLKYWYFIAGFVVLALAVAFFYLKISAITYNVGASILLRTDQGQGSSNSPDFLRAFDLNMADRNFQNEIFFIQSYPLVREVVHSMDVRTSYYLQPGYIPKRLSWSLQNLYKSSPIMVVPQEGVPQPVDLLFRVDIIDDESYRISGVGENISMLSFENESGAGTVGQFNLKGNYRFGDLITHEHASFRVLLNSNYDPALLEGNDLFFRFNNLNQLAGRFKGSLRVETSRNLSTMVNLHFRTDNIGLGMDFLNRLIETYIQRNMDEANLLANQTIEHIERQLENISDDLTSTERQLQTLRTSRNIMSVEDKSRRIFDQLQSAQLRREEAQRRLNHLMQLDDYFVLYKDSAKILAPSAMGLNDQVLNNLFQELTALNTEKQRIISQDQLRNPRLATLSISIENLKSVIAENISFSMNTTRGELNELNSRIEGLNREFSQLPATQRELLGVERSFRLNDATYTSLLERRIHAQIIKASTLPDAKIVEYPGYRGVASPRRTQFYAMSVIIGLLIPSLFITGKTLILNRINGKDEIKNFTQIPVISTIPVVSNARESLIINKPQSQIAEAFFALRSNLAYYLHGETNKTILVTSSIPGEGKSFAAFNLATSFALSNHKTVLLEFDLRKPSNTLEGFNTHGLPGVSSYLINKAKLEEITIQTQLPNLDIIHSGKIPPNPIGLLSGNKTQELMEKLKQQYDIIIIDTPPYGMLTDSFMLMNYADLNLFVTRVNYTRKDVFSATMEDLENKKVENVYILINGDDDDIRGYGYNKYYSVPKKDRLKGFLRKKVAVY